MLLSSQKRLLWAILVVIFHCRPGSGDDPSSRSGGPGSGGKYPGFGGIAFRTGADLQAQKPATKWVPGKSGWYAVRYGQSLFPRTAMVDESPFSSANGQKPSEMLAFGWFVFFLRRDSQLILIDTGICDRAAVKKFGIKDYIPPPKLLRGLAIEAHEITDIILTHSHVDHAGCLGHFSKARVYISQNELKQFTRRPWYPKDFMERLKKDRRLRLIPRSARSDQPWQHSYLPELGLWPSGGHTVGSLVILDERLSSPKIFTGDECYLRAFCRPPYALPNGSAQNQARNRAFIQWTARQVGNGAHVFTGHDPEMVRDRPQIAPGIFYLED